MNLRQKIAFAAALGLLVGLVFSPFLLSLSMWSLAYAGLVRSENGRPRLAVGEALGRLRAEPSFWAMTLIFWIAAASGFWSEDSQIWLERTQVRLPFFVLPLAFAGLDPFKKKQIDWILAFFVALMTAAAAGVLIHFLMHKEAVLNAMLRGHAMPVPRNHVRFSLLVALSAAVGWRLFEQKRAVFSQKNERLERGFWLAATAFLFVFAHVLAVRSGLAAVYALVVFGLFRLVFVQKRWVFGLLAFAGLAAAPFLAIKMSPSLAAKIDYARWDWGQGKNSATEGHSDTDRLISLRAGWAVFLKNPAFGCGLGDLPAEVRRAVFEADSSHQKEVKMPHNQFVYLLAATGAVGLGLHFFAWLAPFFFEKKPRPGPLFWAFQIVLFVSFLVEYTIEGTFGAVMAAFFPILFLWENRAAQAEKA